MAVACGKGRQTVNGGNRKQGQNGNSWGSAAPAKFLTFTASKQLNRCLLILVSGILPCFSGCDSEIKGFSGNQVFARRLELTEQISMEQPLKDAQQLLEQLFGTPDEPQWPSRLAGEDTLALVSLEHLQRAAGAVSSDEQGRHRGLYREHCVTCHGFSGNGLGPSAALLNPYPRDFRMGKFKFKKVPLGVKPSKKDLETLLHRGVVGTGMPAFHLLPQEDIDALVDYVIYLAVRGEAERQLLAFAGTQLALEDGERLFDSDWRASTEEDDLDRLAEAEKYVKDVIEEWHVSWVDEYESPLPPPDFPLVTTSASRREPEVQESIRRGKELFQGNVASCAFCHGMEAAGDGQRNNYDDWTRDYTSEAGLNPADRDELEPMLNIGALKPRPIAPRNLQLGNFRGGSSPSELYLRIVNGIEGTPMPAAPMRPQNPQGLTDEQVWDLVNYLLSMGDPATDESTSVKTPDDEAGAGASSGKESVDG